MNQHTEQFLRFATDRLRNVEQFEAAQRRAIVLSATQLAGLSDADRDSIREHMFSQPALLSAECYSSMLRQLIDRATR